MIEGAAQSYAASHDSALPTMAQLTPAYIKVLPACPAQGAAYAFTAAHDGTLVACDAAGHGHY